MALVLLLPSLMNWGMCKLRIYILIIKCWTLFNPIYTTELFLLYTREGKLVNEDLSRKMCSFKKESDSFCIISFNIGHDALAKKCLGEKNGLHVMAPAVNLQAMPWSWSSCSRQEITEFLE